MFSAEANFGHGSFRGKLRLQDSRSPRNPERIPSPHPPPQAELSSVAATGVDYADVNVRSTSCSGRMMRTVSSPTSRGSRSCAFPSWPRSCAGTTGPKRTSATSCSSAAFRPECVLRAGVYGAAGDGAALERSARTDQSTPPMVNKLPMAPSTLMLSWKNSQPPSSVSTRELGCSTPAG